MAQRFYNLVLLPRIRDDITEYKKLNFHLYTALKKALFKPGAWFKGQCGFRLNPSSGFSQKVMSWRRFSLDCVTFLLSFYASQVV